jgi:hypothetical protein
MEKEKVHLTAETLAQRVQKKDVRMVHSKIAQMVRQTADPTVDGLVESAPQWVDRMVHLWDGKTARW